MSAVGAMCDRGWSASHEILLFIEFAQNGITHICVQEVISAEPLQLVGETAPAAAAEGSRRVIQAYSTPVASRRYWLDADLPLQLRGAWTVYNHLPVPEASVGAAHKPPVESTAAGCAPIGHCRSDERTNVNHFACRFRLYANCLLFSVFFAGNCVEMHSLAIFGNNSIPSPKMPDIYRGTTSYTLRSVTRYGTVD